MYVPEDATKIWFCLLLNSELEQIAGLSPNSCVNRLKVYNASHHRQKKEERGTSGDFFCPSECVC